VAEHDSWAPLPVLEIGRNEKVALETYTFTVELKRFVVPSDYLASPATSAPANPKQPISTTEARATSSAALQHHDLMAGRDRFQHQRGAGSEFASGDQNCFACRHRYGKQSNRQTIEILN
jgi:hypothetical protein